MPLPLVVASAFVVTVVLTPPVQRLAHRIGAVAMPGGRHIHKKPTPTAGGLAIFGGFWAAAMISQWPLSGPLMGIFIGSTLLLALCLLDDVYSLPALPRLVGQILVAIIAFQWGVRIEGLTSPISILGTYKYLALGWFSAPLTVLWIVAVTNAINWLDGLDGLVAGVTSLAGLTLMAFAWGGSFEVVGVMAAAIAGANLGFLPYNFNPARVFMGDTGSMFIGYCLASVAVLGAFKGTTAAVLVPLLVLGVPIFDSLAAVFRRVSEGRSPLSADRGHIHHRLIDRGLSVRQAVLIIYGLTALLCLLALGVAKL